MSRRIVTTAYQGAGGGASDTYFDRIVKYIPSDIVAAWTAVSAAVDGASKAGATIPTSTVLWICFLFGVVITPFWVLKQTTALNAPPAKSQAAVGTVAFIVWVFALGGPFSSLSFYNGLYGTLAIVGFTLVSGLIVPKE
ncbi:MAG: hypothetical protein JWQ94_1527 [Tardiphaga sp.]|nr:hypothetical protein [Tardiphaga sp.]